MARNEVGLPGPAGSPREERCVATMRPGRPILSPRRWPCVLDAPACLAASLAALCLVPPQARAQLIDQYVNPLISGLDVEPGVTVTSRLHPDYDYRGVRVGSFLISPELIESDGYDSNVTGTRPARGSALIQTSGAVRAASDWSSGSLNASISADDFRYTDVSNQSFTNWQASVNGTYDVGRDRAFLGYSHLNLYQTPRDLNVPLLQQPIAYRADEVQLNYRANFSRTYVLPGVTVTNYSFDNGVAGGIPYVQTYRDRVVTAPSVEVGYEIAPRRSVVAVLRDAVASYSNQLLGQPSLNFNDVSLLVGVNYDVSGALSFRLLGGYEARTFTSRQYKTIQAPIVEAAVTWTPTGLTTVTGSAARYIQDSTSEVLVGYTETALRLSVDHEYLRNVTLNATAAYFLDNYPQGGGEQARYSVGGGATWLLNRTMRLGFTYAFTSRQSSTAANLNAGLGVPISTAQGLGLGLGGSYDEHRALLQFRIGL